VGHDHSTGADRSAGSETADSPGTPVVLDAADPAALAAAAAALAGGYVVAVPTDTVYGLAVDPTDADAVAGLFTLKDRPDGVPLPVLVDGLEQAMALADPFGDVAARLAERFWPGPLTLVLPRRAGIALHLGGAALLDTGHGTAPHQADRHAGSSGTVGVRCPDHAMLRALCRASGPLAVSSANRHGEPPCTTAVDVLATFAGASAAAPVLVLDGGRCDGVVSTVVDATGAEPHLLREGALPWPAVLAALGPLPPRGTTA
jgi:L-threonylcarbamoyladenylate synthase